MYTTIFQDERVEDLINNLCINDFYNSTSRAEMVRIFHSLLSETEPEKKKKVRKLFNAVSDALTEYGKSNGYVKGPTII